MSFTQIVGKLDESSRNLNTSPWTVSGLKGDQFDYSFIMFNESTNAVASDVLIRPNGDSGLNCEYYQMWAANTSKGGATDTTQDGFRVGDFVRGVSNRNSLSVGLITGDSSQDRICKFLMCHGYPSLSNFHCVWNNNVDELTSLEFYGTGNASYKWHIVVFETPKVGNGDNWELIDTLSWSASNTEQNFSGLEGDTDIQYLIDWDSSVTPLSVQCNNDGTGSIIIQQVYNNGSAFVASRGTSFTSIQLRQLGHLILNAESGTDRTTFQIEGPNGSAKHHISANWWKNTVDEITSIYCQPTVSTTAKAKLYRRKNPKIPADMFHLPFEHIGYLDFSGDISSGVSFPINGDDWIMLRIEYNGTVSQSILMEPNADTGNNFSYQNLKGDSTAESAASTGAAGDINFGWGSTAETSIWNTVCYLYPQSGEQRPSLTYSMLDEDMIRLQAGWWHNTADEITSLLFKTSLGGTKVANGRLTISGIHK